MSEQPELLKVEQIEKKILELQNGEYLRSEELDFVKKEVDKIIKTFNDFFGYNDGEPLDIDGVEFIITYLKLKWYVTNAIVKEMGDS